MDRKLTLILLCLVVCFQLVNSRLQPRDGSPVRNTGPSTPPGQGHSARGGNAVRFNFKSEGGAMRVLGRQQLSQISSRVGYQGDLRTLASHLDDDDDLVRDR